VRTHQDIEYFVCIDSIGNSNLLEHAVCRVHTCLPKLLGIHLSKTLVSLHAPLLGLCLCFFFCVFLWRIFVTFFTWLFECICVCTKHDTLLFVGVCIVHLLATLNLVEWRLCDVEETAVDDGAEVAIKECEQECTNVRTVYVG